MEKFTFFWKSQSPFSQWHRKSFTIKGQVFYTAEQYMMYSKALLFEDLDIARKVLQTTDPKEQKSLGRKVKNFDNVVWEDNREKIVYEGNKAKFTQNKDLLKALLDTTGTTLVEASPYDKIWGIGMEVHEKAAKNRATWKGLNLLGKVLTELREDLIKPNTL